MLNQIPLRTKILLFSLIISVFPLMIVGFLAYRSSTQVIDENMNEYALNITEQLAVNIDNFVFQYDQKIKEISFSDTMQSDYYDLVGLVKEENPRISEMITYQNQIESSFYDHIISDSYIGAIAFYSDEVETSLSAGIQTPLWDYKDTKVFHDAMVGNNETLWLKNQHFFQKNGDEDFFTLLYATKNRFYNKKLGVLAMTVSADALTDRYKSSIPEHGIMYILDEKGMVVSSNIEEDIGSEVDGELLMSFHASSDYEVIEADRFIKGKPMHFVIMKLEHSGWYVMNGMSYEVMTASNFTILLVIWTAIVLLIISIVLITSFISRYISIPIRDMRSVMAQVGKGDFSRRLDDVYKDEFQELSQGFNNMLDEISLLRKNEKTVHMEMGKAQFLSLQAQINPHFIYNTLETINWMANMVDSDDIALMITSLGNILRFSLDKSVTTTTVENEIKNLDYYIKIQQIRYKNKLNIHLDIEQEIYEFKVIKFILQPLVENSIYHAFKYFSEDSFIQVVGRKIENHMVFKVIDNGLGMSSDTVQHYIGSSDEEEKGYGLSNVIKRISVYYGQEGTVDIISCQDEGTKIILKIPAIYEDGKWT